MRLNGYFEVFRGLHANKGELIYNKLYNKEYSR